MSASQAPINQPLLKGKEGYTRIRRTPRSTTILLEKCTKPKKPPVSRCDGLQKIRPIRMFQHGIDSRIIHPHHHHRWCSHVRTTPSRQGVNCGASAQKTDRHHQSPGFYSMETMAVLGKRKGRKHAANVRRWPAHISPSSATRRQAVLGRQLSNAAPRDKNDRLLRDN